MWHITGSDGDEWRIQGSNCVCEPSEWSAVWNRIGDDYRVGSAGSKDRANTPNLRFATANGEGVHRRSESLDDVCQHGSPIEVGESLVVLAKSRRIPPGEDDSRAASV
jgi:hypothetical protein